MCGAYVASLHATMFITISETTAQKRGSIGDCSFQKHKLVILNFVLAGHKPAGGAFLARPNFKYEKRQKELAKQKKNEEKRLRKLEKRNEGSPEIAGEESIDTIVSDVPNE